VHPIVVLTIDGKPVSLGFMSRLISVTVTDKEGTTSDTIDIELDAGPPAMSVPRQKAIITCSMGYQETGVAYMGTFTADEIELGCLPYKVKIQGKSADMREKLKEHRERHFDNKSVGDIVSQVAGEHGLQAQVSGNVGSHKYPWFGQQSESALHMVKRLADRHGALFAIKDNKLIFAEKGAGLTASGVAVGGVVVTPQMIVEGTCTVKFVERPAHNKVRGAWHDKDKAERTFEEAPADPEGKASYTLRHQYSDKGEAQNAAKSKGKDLQQAADTTSVTIEGNVAARGGGNMVYAGVHPQVDGLPWIIETAVHRFSKSPGYQTQIDGKAKV
jgi:hypothetical protein